MSIKIVQLTPFIGVEILEFDIDSITENEASLIDEAFNTYQLLIFRDIPPLPDSLLKISTIFGEAVPSLAKAFCLKEYPLITVLSNVTEDGKNIGGMVPAHVWHSDGYLTPHPYRATALLAAKVPSNGGETLFVNMRNAYDLLDGNTKKYISNKAVRYNSVYLDQPFVEHFLVIHNPVNNLQALYVNINQAQGVVGMATDEAKILLEQLYSLAISNETYVHKWKEGDLVIWDNFSTMHSATENPTDARLLYRLQIG